MLPAVKSMAYTLRFVLEATANIQSNRPGGRVKLLLVAPCFTQEVEKSGLVGREELLWSGDCVIITDLKWSCWSRTGIPMLLL